MKGRSVRLGPIGIARVLKNRAELRRRTRWTRERLKREQDRGVALLRRFAYERSLFYREFHAGLAAKPLEDLPILTKTTLMENWDRVTTNPELHLEFVLDFVTRPRTVPQLFQDEYYALTTSGSSGFRGAFVYNRDEWCWILASYARSNDWADVAAGVLLSPRARGDIARAFGVDPFETYAATETAGIASDCQHHHLHAFETL